jgi:hypothetical protein
MKLHIKGFLLTRLHQLGGMRDQALINLTLQAYSLQGRYAINSLHVALDELSAAGLVARNEPQLITDSQSDVLPRESLSFYYQLTAFGLTRMQDTGLLAKNGNAMEEYCV